jgi:hypothetical protein
MTPRTSIHSYSYSADLIVERCALVELKAAKQLDDVHAAQCLNP